MRYWLSSAIAVAAVAYALLLGIREDVQQVSDPYQPQRELLTDQDVAISRLATLITFPTLANLHAPNHISNPAPFQQLHEFLRTAFPTVFSTCKVETINTFSLLLTWEGKDTSLPPIVLMSHMDVVPAPEYKSGASWTYPPFDGTVADGYIWGRGTMDTKNTLAGLLEAASQLIKQGFSPRRTVIFAIGHDEEVGGTEGAKAIAETLKKRLGSTLPELVLDEGGCLLTDGLNTNGINVIPRPVALVGTAEKGYQNWILHINGTAGHSSMPPTGTGTSVAARISRVITALEKDQTSTRLAAPVSDWLKAIGPFARWAPVRLLLSLADNWIINPMLSQVLGAAGGELSAQVRSTVAVVGIQSGGEASNVLPGDGRILLNVRVLSGDDEASIRSYLSNVVYKEREHVSIELAKGDIFPASPVSPGSGPAFELLHRVIVETLWDGTGPAPLVSPYLVPGMTDSRWYQHIAPGKVFKFSPLRANRSAGELKRVHGVDERIGTETYLTGVRFYMRFMKLAAGDGD